MPATTPLGIPYLLGTDPANQIATVDANKANWLDPRLRIAAGEVTVPVANAAAGSVTVTFPAGRFTAAPIVVGSANTNAYNIAAASVTTTSMSLLARHIDGTASTSNVLVRWHAIQVWP